MNALVQTRPSLAEYLSWEEAQPERHEYHRGEVFAMVGAKRVHGRVVSNLVVALAQALKGSPCQVFHEGMKLQVGEDTVLYPDVFVTRSPQDLATDQIFKEPSVVVEVLSPSTQVYDRSQKFALYRRLPSLREYLLVDPETQRVEAFRRMATQQWVLDDMSEAATLQVPALGVAFAMSDVFAGMA
jgi:Uma2 family endonuclease